MNQPLKVLSLFSGAGGFDLGLERAGMQTVFQCEWDKNCQSTLKKNWPDVPKWDDVSTLTGSYILEHAPVIDIVAWGSPCQDLSIAGKRAGLSGERSGLFREGIRIIKELRELTDGKYPRISIWENVAGALSSRNGADFGQVLYEMDEAGACFSEWRLLDAQYFGIPQRRRRVFLVSVFDPAAATRCPNPLLPVSESMRGNIETSAEAGQETSRSSSASTGENSNEPILIDRAAYNQGQNAKFIPVISDDPITPPLVAKGPHAVATFVKSRRAHTIDDHEIWLEKELAPTINAFDSSPIRATAVAVTSDLSVRRLTPIECERLMGWPDNWTDGVSATARFKQCGNGVAAPVAQWVGEHIVNIFYDNPIRKYNVMTNDSQQDILSFDTQFGSNADVFKNIAPPLKASQQPPTVVY